MTVEEQLRALGTRLDEVQEPIAPGEALRRAGVDTSDVRSPSGRRWWLIAAVFVLVVGGVLSLVALDTYDEDPLQPVDSGVIPGPATTTPAPPTTSTSSTTTVPAPSTTAAGEQTVAGWSGGLLDDLDTGSLRPLVDYSEGDAIIPTAPSGWRVQDSTSTSPDDAVGPDFVEWSVDVIEARSDERLGYVLYLSLGRAPRCVTTLGCQPSGETITIDGVVWESVVVERIPDDDPEVFDETTLRAQVGDRWIWVGSGAPQALNGRPLLENPQVIEFLEGLRVGSPEVVQAIGEACRDCGGAGSEGDPFAAVESSTAVPVTTTDAAPATAPRAASGLDAVVGRPLTELTEGDVLIPTYVPPGLELEGRAQIHDDGIGSKEFSLVLNDADGMFANSVRLWEGGAPWSPLGPEEMGDPNHPPVEIAGLTWGWIDFETARAADIGPFSVWVYLHGLDRSEAVRFIEGLRAVSADEFGAPISVDDGDGISVINDPALTEVVAGEERFELTAVRVGDGVCTKLEEIVIPETMGFAGNCADAEQFAESGLVDLVSLDATDTEHLIIGVIDSPSATAVRLTSPDGASVVVPTGPVNDAIAGRFFLARLDLDVSGGIRLDLFTIEDASA